LRDILVDSRMKVAPSPHISRYFTFWTRSPFFDRQLTGRLSFSVN
jgi:hypothetical protein